MASTDNDRSLSTSEEQELRSTLPEHVREAFDAYDVLNSDVKRVLDLLEGADLPSVRRDFVRTVIASIEALINCFRQRVLTHVDKDPKLFSNGEIAQLRGEAYYLTDTGRVRVRPTFAPLPASLSFVLEMNRYFDTTLAIDTNSPDWTRFKRVVEVRNRLTHPRNVQDLDVSDAEVADTKHTQVWLLRSVLGGLIKQVEAGRAQAERLKSAKADADTGADEVIGRSRS